MQTYIITALTPESATAAQRIIIEALTGRYIDTTPVNAHIVEITPPITNNMDEDGLFVIITPGTYTDPVWKFEVTVHDVEPLPEWPENIVAESGISSFAFA